MVSSGLLVRIRGVAQPLEAGDELEVSGEGVGDGGGRAPDGADEASVRLGDIDHEFHEHEREPGGAGSP